jgi:hypothetical protein
MGHPDGAHTHGSGGSGLGTAVLVILGAALAVKLAGPVVAVVSQLVYVFMIVVAVAAVAGAAGAAGVFIWRRRTRPKAARTVLLPPQVRAAQTFPAPQRRAIEARGQVHIHHHWHGVTAEDVAAILRDGHAVNPGSGPRVTPAWPKRE